MTSAPTRITLVPHSHIQNAVAQAKSEWKETSRFNTAHHTKDKIAAVVPKDKDFHHRMPSYYPSLISHWIPLICSSQGNSTCYVFEISRFLAGEIAALYAVWYSGRQLDAEARQDLKSLFPKTTAAGIPTEEVFQG